MVAADLAQRRFLVSTVTVASPAGSVVGGRFRDNNAEDLERLLNDAVQARRDTTFTHREGAFDLLREGSEMRVLVAVLSVILRGVYMR